MTIVSRSNSDTLCGPHARRARSYGEVRAFILTCSTEHPGSGRFRLGVRAVFVGSYPGEHPLAKALTWSVDEDGHTTRWEGGGRLERPIQAAPLRRSGGRRPASRCLLPIRPEGTPRARFAAVWPS